jgi:hypothetical protein
VPRYSRQGTCVEPGMSCTVAVHLKVTAEKVSTLADVYLMCGSLHDFPDSCSPAQAQARAHKVRDKLAVQQHTK